MNRKTLLISVLFAIAPSLAFASFTPGQTLDPQCLPSDSACVVVAPPTNIAGYFSATSTTATSTFAGGFNVAGSNGFSVLQSGVATIGTQTPSTDYSTAKLTVNDSSTGTYSIAMSIGNTSSTTWSNLQFQNDASAQAGWIGVPGSNAYSTIANRLMVAGWASGVTLMGATDVRFDTGGYTLGYERMRITNTGVGIGTTSPTYNLDVNGNAHFTSLVDAANFVATSSTATSTFAGGLIVGANKFVVDRSTGNIGIATSTPTSKITIDDTNTGITVPLSIQNFGTGGWSTLQMKNDAGYQVLFGTVGSTYATANIRNRTVMYTDGDGLDLIANWVNSPNIPTMRFYTQGFSSIGFERMRIDTNGFLAIGTTSASSRLEVSGSSASTALSTLSPLTTLSVSNINTTNNSFATLAFRTQDATNGAATSTAQISAVATSHTASAVTGDLAFQTLNAGLLSESMRITAGGSVGIGTTTPIGKLQVSGVLPRLYLSDTLGAVNNKHWFIENNAGTLSLGTTSDSLIVSTPRALSISNQGDATFYGTTLANHVSAKGTLAASNISQRTNLQLFSEQIDNSAYRKVNSSVSADSTTAPDGTATADLITGTGSGASGFDIYPTDYGSSLNTYVTLSVYAKAGTASEIDLGSFGVGSINARFNLTTGALIAGNGTSVALPNGWFRFSTTYIKLNQFWYAAVTLENGAATSNTAYVWGVQYELGTSPTSYIKTTSTSAAASTLSVVGNAAIGTTFGSLSAPTGGLLVQGNVGIGTSTPTAQLSTTGTVRFSNFGAGTLTTDASGNLSVSSDERLKNVDGSFTRGLADIVKLNPISYHWNAISGLDMQNSYSGFSAQNVQSAIPEAVGTTSNGYLTLQDRPILAAVVNAVKDIGSVSGIFKDNLVAWLGNASNGVGAVFAASLHAHDTICVDDQCLTKSDVHTLLQIVNDTHANAGIGASSNGVAPLIVSPDAPTSSIETVPVATTTNQ
jgi:hypothetical protein